MIRPVTIRSASLRRVRSNRRGPLAARLYADIVRRYRTGDAVAAAIPLALLRRNWSWFLRLNALLQQHYFQQALHLTSARPAERHTSSRLDSRMIHTVVTQWERSPAPRHTGKITGLLELVLRHQKAVETVSMTQVTEQARMSVQQSQKTLEASAGDVQERTRLLPELVTHLRRRAVRFEALHLTPTQHLVRARPASQAGEAAPVPHFATATPPDSWQYAPGKTIPGASAAPLSIDRLTDQVMRQIDRRLVASRERKGRF